MYSFPEGSEVRSDVPCHFLCLDRLVSRKTGASNLSLAGLVSVVFVFFFAFNLRTGNPGVNDLRGYSTTSADPQLEI